MAIVIEAEAGKEEVMVQAEVEDFGATKDAAEGNIVIVNILKVLAKILKTVCLLSIEQMQQISIMNH